MSRRILVRITDAGVISVEADGFRGSGCEAATQALEAALGQTVGRTLKPEHRQSVSIQQTQGVGEAQPGS